MLVYHNYTTLNRIHLSDSVCFWGKIIRWVNSYHHECLNRIPRIPRDSSGPSGLVSPYLISPTHTWENGDNVSHDEYNHNKSHIT